MKQLSLPAGQPLMQKGKGVVLPSSWLHWHHQYCPDIGNAAKFKAADVIYQVVTKRSFHLFSSRHLNSQRNYYFELQIQLYVWIQRTIPS